MVSSRDTLLELAFRLKSITPEKSLADCVREARAAQLEIEEPTEPPTSKAEPDANRPAERKGATIIPYWYANEIQRIFDETTERLRALYVEAPGVVQPRKAAVSTLVNGPAKAVWGNGQYDQAEWHLDHLRKQIKLWEGLGSSERAIIIWSLEQLVLLNKRLTKSCNTCKNMKSRSGECGICQTPDLEKWEAVL